VKASLLFLILLIGRPSSDQVKDYLSCHLNNAPFSTLTNEILTQTGRKVFYDEAMVEKVKVTINSDSISVQSALEIALIGMDIKISPWNNNFVLLPKDNLVSALPNFEKINSKSDSTSTPEETTGVGSEFITTRKANAVEIFKVGKKGVNGHKPSIKVSGKILDYETGAPLLNATIQIIETGRGAATDANGSFTLTLGSGKYNAKIECLGHEKKKIFIEVLSEGELSILLKKEDLLIDEVLVYGDQKNNIKSKEPGLERIASKTIRDIPVMIGDRDILKVSALLPGIVSVGEGSSGLNVRGGSSDQNAFYIDKVPIYNTSHLFGFFPAFNSDIIKDFSIYKGYVPAMYGGRLSSVFNIDTREGNNKYLTTHGGLNPITGYLTVEGPIFNDSLTMLLSGRTSYSDWILSKIKDPTIRNSSAKFSDFSASVCYSFKKSKLSVFAYNSNDKFSLYTLNKYEYSNLGGSINLQSKFSKSLTGEFSLVGSEYSFNTTDTQEPSTSYSHDYKLQHYEFRTDFNHTLGPKMSLDYGTSMILYKLNRGKVLPYGLYSLRNPLNLGKEQGVESSIYITDVYNILPRVTLSLGFRQSLYCPIGPKTVYTYQENSPREVNYIEDTLYYSKNKIIKKYFSPEIRSSINFQTDKNGSIKLAFNQMQQNLFMLSNTIAVAPNTQWKLADYHLKPSKSYQLSFGVFRNFPKEKLEASVEVYYKKTKNYPEFKDGANFLDNPTIETAILQGDQNSYGIELFIKRSAKNVEGWISYTYSRSFVKINGANSWDQINNGDVYPSNYDIPHAFNALINYHFNRRVTISTVTTYQTGKPVTYPVSIYYINGKQFVDYSKRNKYNIPDYFRIDASVTVEGNLKKKKLIHSSVMFSVYNMLGRKNAYSVYFKSIGAQVYCYKYSVIGVPIFTVTWIFKLGNYDSD